MDLPALLLNIQNTYLQLMKIPSTRSHILFLGLIILSIWVASSREIEVTAIRDNTPLSVKLGVSKTITQPDFDFKKIYKRQANKVYSEGSSTFPPCKQNKPEIEFDVLDQIIFEGIPTRPYFIQNFEDIQYSQFLLDAFFEDQKVYLIFKHGKVAIITLQTNEKIKQKAVFDVTGLDPNEFLQVGYFVKVKDYLLFVNNNRAIRIQGNTAQVIPGYYNHNVFESVHEIENGTFGVVEAEKGVTIYHYDGTKIRKVQVLPGLTLFPGHSLKTSLKDIIYWKAKQLLMVLDHFEGIRTFKLTLDFDPADLPQTREPTDKAENIDKNPKTSTDPDYTTKNIIVTDSERISSEFGCKVMYQYDTKLYVYCDILWAYNLEQWPIKTEWRLPYPNIEVKQIYEVGDVLALVGRNVFSVLYLERLVNYYEDGNLDKLLFYKNMFISANEEGIDIGNFIIIPPYTTCYTESEYYLGTHQLQFRTYAECNEDYFKKYNVNRVALGQINPDDVCVYTVYKDLSYWKVGEVKTMPFLIALLVILGLSLAAVVVFLMKKAKIARVMQMIEEYSVNPQSDSAKPEQLQEQLDGGFETNSKRAQREDQNKKASQAELNQEVHVIA